MSITSSSDYIIVDQVTGDIILLDTSRTGPRGTGLSNIGTNDQIAVAQSNNITWVNANTLNVNNALTVGGNTVADIIAQTDSGSAYSNAVAYVDGKAFVNSSQLSTNLANYTTTSSLTSNLTNYQTLAGLSANVAGLIANNTSFVGSVTAANVVSNAQLTANLANYTTTSSLTSNLANYALTSSLSAYQTTAGLAANVAILAANSATYILANNGLVSNSSGVFALGNTGLVVNSTGIFVNSTYIATLIANNTSFVGSVTAANVVSNAQLSANLANYALTSPLSAYQTTAGLSANVATLAANAATYLNGNTAAALIAFSTSAYSNAMADTLSRNGTYTGNNTFSANSLFTGALVQFGGNTASFSALKANGTSIDFRLADDTGFAGLRSSTITATGLVYTDLGNFSTANNMTIISTGNTSAPQLSIGASASGIRLSNNWSIGWVSNNAGSTTNVLGTTPDVTLVREAAGELGQRAGATAQRFSVYYSYTDASNYERGFMVSTSTGFIIGQAGAGSGTNRGIKWSTGGSSRWEMLSTGHFQAFADNTYDIGQSGQRPRSVYAATSFLPGSTATIAWSTRAILSSPADKVLKIADTAGTGPAILYSGQFTYANLPAAATYPGSTAFITDATATTPRSTAAGGGSNKVMVMSDGTNWLIVA